MSALEALPEVGLRAPWYAEPAWREILALSLPGHEVGGGFAMLPLDDGPGELAIHLYAASVGTQAADFGPN